MSEMLSFELGPSWTVDSWYGPALWQRGRPSGCSSDRNDRVHLVKRSIKSVQWNPLNESPEYLDNKNPGKAKSSRVGFNGDSVLRSLSK